MSLCSGKAKVDFVMIGPAEDDVEFGHGIQYLLFGHTEEEVLDNCLAVCIQWRSHEAGGVFCVESKCCMCIH